MKKKLRLIGLVAVVLCFASSLFAQSIEGIWKTVDDETGKTKSEVQLEIKDGLLYGTITKLYKEPGEDLDPLCTECSGINKDKKIIGMQIVNGLEKSGVDWKKEDGILDPANGKLYFCKMWLDSDDPKELKVRGYIGFLYRTQTWYKVK